MLIIDIVKNLFRHFNSMGYHYSHPLDFHLFNFNNHFHFIFDFNYNNYLSPKFIYKLVNFNYYVFKNHATKFIIINFNYFLNLLTNFNR